MFRAVLCKDSYRVVSTSLTIVVIILLFAIADVSSRDDALKKLVVINLTIISCVFVNKSTKENCVDQV